MYTVIKEINKKNYVVGCRSQLNVVKTPQEVRDTQGNNITTTMITIMIIMITIMIIIIRITKRIMIIEISIIILINMIK